MPGWSTFVTSLRLEKSLKKFYGRYQDLIEKYHRSSRKCWMIHSQDNPYLIYARILVVFCCFTWIFHLDLSTLYLIASCDGCHAWGRRRLLYPEHLIVLLARPISHNSIQYMDFVEIFNVPLDLSAICLLVLVSVELPFCVVVTQFWECSNLVSGIKLSIRSFCFITSRGHTVKVSVCYLN